jgi:hypothetical protein
VTSSGWSRGGQVPGAGHHDQACPRDGIGDLGRQLGWGQLVAVADQHQGRAADGAKPGPRVGVADDRLLLADERLGPGLLGHLSHQLPDRRVALAGGVDQQGELLVGDLGEAAAAGQGDLGIAALGQLGGVGAGAGVQQGQPRDPVGAWRAISKQT